MTKNRGFTLIEVLVAAGILGIVATALFGLLSTSLSNLGKVERLHQYQLAALDVMNRVLFLPTLPAPATAEGFIDNLDARWSISIDPWESDKVINSGSQALVKVHVVVTWPGNTTDRTLDLESLKATKIENYDLANRIQTVFPQY
jgi:prepilin-type N-terminal cleavage/methylation domain-containing protein